MAVPIQMPCDDQTWDPRSTYVDLQPHPITLETCGHLPDLIGPCSSTGSGQDQPTYFLAIRQAGICLCTGRAAPTWGQGSCMIRQ